MSSYWIKKTNAKKFRCCGKTKSGERCKNEFHPIDKITLTCAIHKNQKDATFWYESQIGQFKDVAKLIAGMINEPKVFSAFAQVCRSTAKACHELQSVKIQEWRRICMYNPGGIHITPSNNIPEVLTKLYILPNGSTVDSNNNFTNIYLSKMYKLSGKELTIRVNREKRVIT